MSSGSDHTYFVSYSWADCAVADHVELLLLRNQRRVNRDETDIRAGGGLTESIRSLISKSDTFLALISEDYATSRWCPDELSFALERQAQGVRPRRVIPLRLDLFEGNELPISLTDVLWLESTSRIHRSSAVSKVINEEPQFPA